MYVIKVLENKEYDKLPYRRIKESLGCADPKTKTAYVRRVYWGNISKTVNLLTIQHELEELVAKTSPHEEDGIRYKKGRDIFAPIATVIGSIINPFLGAAMAGGYGAYKQSKGEQGLGQTLLNTALAFTGGKLSQMSKTATPVATIPATAGGAQGTGTVISTIPGQAAKAILPSGASALSATIPPNLGMISATLPAVNNISWNAPSALSSAKSVAENISWGAAPSNSTLLQTATRGGATTATGALKLPTGTPEGVKLLKTAGATGLNIGQQPGFQQTVGESIKTIGTSVDILNALDNPLVKLGLGSMAVSALPISPEPPSLGEVTAKWLTPETVTKAGEKARAIVDIKYTGDFMPSKETMSYINVIQGDIKKAYKRRADDMDKYGLAANEQWMTSGERLEMLRRLGEDEQSELTKVEKELILNSQQQHAQQQFEYVMSELRADEQTKRDLLYGELSDIIWRYNIKQEDLMNFRKIAADAGIYLTAKGLGIV